MLDSRLVEMSMAQQSLSRAAMPSAPDQSEETVFINPKIEDTSLSDDTLCSNTEESSNQQQVMMEQYLYLVYKCFKNISCKNKGNQT